MRPSPHKWGVFGARLLKHSYYRQSPALKSRHKTEVAAKARAVGSQTVRRLTPQERNP